MSFGDFMNETVVFHQIPVAYVTEEGQFDAFQAVLESLEEEEELVELILVDREEAEALLKDEKVEGIYQRAVSSAAQDAEPEMIGIEQSAFSLLSDGQASTTGLTRTSSRPPPIA